MSCRDIRMGFSEALDAAPGSEERVRIESHCEGCAICGPEWRTLLKLEELMAVAPAPPPGFADRVMAALPAPAPVRRELMPLAAAGLIAACILVGLSFFALPASAGPWLAPFRDLQAGFIETVRSRVAASPWQLTGWVLAGIAAAGALSGVMLGRVRQVVG